MDITDTLAPTSDQLDAVDLATSGPRTFTVVSVKAGSEDQPVQVQLAEFPRVWRPSKGMRQVLAAAWGTNAKLWTDHRVRLYCDPDVRFGGIEVGGIRISHLSHIDKPLPVPLIVTRGKSAVFKVQPLKEEPPATRLTVEDIAACDNRDALKAAWRAHPDLRAAITARVAELDAQAQTADLAQGDTLGVQA